MSGTAYLAATSGSPPLAQQINQFLGTHPTTFLYTAVLKSSQTVNGSTHTNSNGQYMAQSFTTAAGQTAIGYVLAPITSFTASGASLGTMTLSLYANSGGAPTGSPLVSTTITTEYAYAAAGMSFTTSVLYPLPITGLTASTEYWLVTSPAGGSGVHYGWEQSNQTSGASLSTNGTAWTAQTYGFQYAVYDRTPSGYIVATWEDSGARWTTMAYGATVPTISARGEYTVGQTSSGYNQGYRSFSYTNGLLGSAT